MPRTLTTQLKCPECDHSHLIKFGFKYHFSGDVRVPVQQYQCKSCHRITIYPLPSDNGSKSNPSASDEVTKHESDTD